jgi:hypothetical protein
MGLFALACVAWQKSDQKLLIVAWLSFDRTAIIKHNTMELAQPSFLLGEIPRGAHSQSAEAVGSG